MNQILHCAETIRGGIASYLRDLVACQARDFGPDRITVVVPASQVEDLIVPSGVRVVTFADRSSRATNALRLAFRVARLALATAPDVVHVHSTFAGATVRPALAMLGMSKKVVYCPHGWAWDRNQSKLNKHVIQAFERSLSFFTARVICISEHERREAEQAGFAVSRLELIVNGIAEQSPQPTDQVMTWPPGKKRLLFVGRFDRQKGVDLFLQALEILGPEAHGVLAGSRVVGGVRTLKIPDNVEVIGWVNQGQLQSLFETADVLVVPSRWEGFGLIAAEAMRAALPVLASNVGGLTEVVQDGGGMLFEPGGVQEIVEAVRKNSPEQWARMGQQGRARFRKFFTIERVHNQMCDVYRQVCGLSKPSEIKPVLRD